MTLEETARIFSDKWNKEVNRTHIARIKQNFKSMGQLIQEDLVAALQDDQREFALERERMKHSGSVTVTNVDMYSSFLNIPHGNQPIDGGMISDASDDYKHSVSSNSSSIIQSNPQVHHGDSSSSVSYSDQLSVTDQYRCRSEPRSVIQPNHQSVIIKNQMDAHYPKPCIASRGEALTPPHVYRCPQCPKLYDSAHEFWHHLRVDHFNALYSPQSNIPFSPSPLSNTAPNQHSSFRHDVMALKQHIH